MSKSLEISSKGIVDKIYFLLGHKVMLDKDLAEMYGVKPIRLREQVKRNKLRFPGNFMFQLKEKEVDFMVSQNAIPSRKYLGGSLPYAFTEHGVLRLANILKSERAIQVSIRIIEVFVNMREMLITHKDILVKLERLEKKILKQDQHVKKHEDEIQVIFEALKQLLEPQQEPRKKVGYRRKDEKE